MLREARRKKEKTQRGYGEEASYRNALNTQIRWSWVPDDQRSHLMAGKGEAKVDISKRKRSTEKIGNFIP